MTSKIASVLIVCFCFLLQSNCVGQVEEANESRSTNDYVRLANEIRGSESIDFEQNAAPKLIAAIGGDRYKPTWEVLAPDREFPQGSNFESAPRTLQDSIKRCMAKPWKYSRKVSRWIDANEGVLKQIAAAVEAKYCYFPLIAKPNEGLTTAPLEYLFDLRGIGKCLVARSMRYLRLGNVDECLADLATARKLAGHMGNSGFVIEQMLAANIEQYCAAAELHVLKSGKISPEQAVRHQKLIVKLSESNKRIEFAFRLERLVSLDSMRMIESKDFSEQLGLKLPTVDNEKAREEIHDLYDKLDQACAQKIPADAFSKLQQVNGAFKEFEDNIKKAIERKRQTERAFAQDHEFLSRLAGQYIAIVTFPAFEQLFHMDMDRLALERQILLAIQLELHRLEERQFPGKLGELKLPKEFSALNDPYTSEPFSYCRIKDGYHLFGVGRNREDNSGIGIEDQWQVGSKDFGFQLILATAERSKLD